MPENFDYEIISFTNGSLSATMTDTDAQPNKVIELGTTCHVIVDWYLDTSDPWLLNNTTWKLEVFAESIGMAPEVKLISSTRPAMPPDSVSGIRQSWQTDLAIDTSLPLLGLEDGAYKLVVLLTHTAMVSGIERKTRMAGFVEIPMVQFYTHET